MTRRTANWLQAYRDYTKESESPESFHLWTGLSVLASAVRRNVYLDQGIYLLFVNQYVVLIGPAGKVNKSTSIRMGRTLLHQIEGIKFGPDAMSKEELIRQMARANDKEQSALVLHSSELSSLIGTSGLGMIQFLTDIYDCDWNPKGWRYSTKTSGRDVIKNPVLNILAGTTPSWIADEMPRGVVEHGFTSRTIFVYEDEPRFLNPRPTTPNARLVEDLVVDLQHISEIEGPFAWTDDGFDFFDTYYRELYAKPPQDHRIASFHWRKKVHVLKIAMLLSIAESDSLVLERRDLVTAAEIIDDLDVNLSKTFSAVGKYEFASDLERIIYDIEQNNGMQIAEIYRRNYYIGGDEVGRILQSLLLMQRAKREDRNGNAFLVPTHLR